MEFGRIIKKFKIGERRKCAQNSMNITILPKVQAENQRRFFACLDTIRIRIWRLAQHRHIENLCKRFTGNA